MKITFFLLLFILSGNAFSDVAMSATTFKRLQNIEDLRDKNNKAEAERKLVVFLNSPPSREIDKAYLYYTAGMFYLDEPVYSKVSKYLLKSYQLNALPEKNVLYILQTLAGVSMQSESWAKAIKYYKLYIKQATKPDKNIYLSLGTAYFYKKEYQNTIRILNKAKSLFGNKKSIYLMLFSSYYELKQLKNATKILEKMVRIWSDEKRYWMQLSSIYIERKRYSQALAILQIAKVKKYLTKENEILQYTYLLNEKGMPNKAAKTLKKAMKQGVVKKSLKNYELLATLFQEAKERNKAIEALIKASNFSKNGKNDLYIAQLYFEQENQFKNVIKYAKKALKKGVKQKGSANMLIAVAYSESSQIEKAKVYLNRAVKYKKTKKSAQQWLNSLR